MGTRRGTGGSASVSLTTRSGWNALAVGLAISVMAHPGYARGKSPAAPLPGQLSGVFTTGSLQSLQLAWQEVVSSASLQKINRTVFNSLTAAQHISDGEMQTVKFQDFYKGVEVLGSMVMHHRTGFGTEITDRIAIFDLDTTPTLSPEDAVAVARTADEALTLAQAPELKILPSSDDRSAKLIYWVTMKSDSADRPGADLVIEAHSGKVIANVSHWVTIEPTASVEVYEASSQCQDVDRHYGWPLAYDESLCKQTVSQSEATAEADPSSRRALANSLKTLDYFARRHKRDSYDGAGAPLRNVVHIGHRFNNAFWDSHRKVMAYGDGDGRRYGDFTQAVDVAGHEMTHALVSETAKLVNWGQSGALNEAYADFFGKMVANDGNWAVGAAVFLKGTRSGVRDLAKPGNLDFVYEDDWGRQRRKRFPAHMKEKMPEKNTCDATNDKCWVHINSTIFGHAAYRVVEKVGKARAERIFYRTLTHLLTPTDDFKAARTATLTACKQLRYTSAVCKSVESAFAEVGL